MVTALSDGEDTHSEVTSDWQVIDLELGDAEGQVLLTVLRPPEWLPYVDPDGDGTFELELPELRLRGIAHVIHVRGPPDIVDAPGRVVLSTVEHRVESVLALTFDDANEVVTTPNHPFYSVSRGWTAAGELQLGEAVETRDGEQTLRLTEYRAEPQSVFNLEVEGDHEYLVGESGLRVHNNCGARLPRFNGPKPRYHVNNAHVAGRGLRRANGKTPLPSDAEDVYRRAVPDSATAPRNWFGRNAQGQTYRYSPTTNNTVHFSGDDGVGDGIRNITPYARARLDAL